jgi:hypothetical protein
LALAGCGGSSSSSSSSGSTTSRASFITQASAICTNVNTEVAALPAIRTGAELLKTGARELAESSAALDQLKAVTPPAATKVAFGRYVAGIVQEEAILKQALAAIKAGNSAQAQRLAVQSKTLGLKDNAEANNLGLPACAANAEPGDASSSSSSS